MASAVYRRRLVSDQARLRPFAIGRRLAEAALRTGARRAEVLAGADFARRAAGLALPRLPADLAAGRAATLDADFLAEAFLAGAFLAETLRAAGFLAEAFFAVAFLVLLTILVITSPALNDVFELFWLKIRIWLGI